MRRVPLNPADTRSRTAFERFLGECREVARARGRPQLVSVSVEAGHLDPLAVLESIYEADELHFYCERPSEHMAVAGAEAVLLCSPEGVDRFGRARRFVEETLEHTIAVGDLDLPFAGPHFLTAAGFFDRTDPSFPFPAATIFVPRWQVGRDAARCTAVANLLLDAEAPIEALAERVWRAHAKFQSFHESDARFEPPSEVRDRIPVGEVGAKDGFADSVRRALRLIDDGVFQKIVLARAIEAAAEAEFHPLAILNTLRGRFPDCYAFSVGNGRGQSFIGASPECLVRMRGGELVTEALAGSAPRGASAGEDAALASRLLKSEKDLREHALVVESLVRRLRSLGLEPEIGSRPRLRRFSNVQHLHSPLRARVNEGVHVFDAVASLHPTPAVGGSPREAACGHIAALEPFSRGLYAGPIGWADARGGGEFLVAIRSALIDGARARVFAGSGIVAGSEPAREHAETELKFRAMLDVLTG